MYKHFIITRFNLKKEDWKTNKNKVEVLTDEWHRNRFELFLNYCVPGMSSQTNTNFEWLVFFDTSTAPEFRLIIADIEAKLPNFKPFFIDGMNAFFPAIQEQITLCKSEYIITSRLDNDDCVSKFYIESIQNKFNKQDFLALDYINGYTLQISPSYILGKRLQQFNPFLSLIEKNDNPKTIWQMNHGDWKKENRLTQIKDEYIWTSIIHEENKANKFKGFDHVPLNAFLEEFSFSESVTEKLKSEVKNQFQWTATSINNKLNSHWTYQIKKLKKQLGFYS